MDLFGHETMVQGEIDLPESPPTLTALEESARRTVLRLGEAVRLGGASRREMEQYRESLALLRRSLKYSEEEIVMRLRLGREM